MLSVKSLIPAFALFGFTAAHFSIEEPPWRGDSFEAPASQYTFPCAGINSTDTTNRTEWPLTGGSLLMDVHHPWAYTYINLGLGYPTNNFNITLLPVFNQTGNGTFCIAETGRAALEQLSSRGLISDGTNATVQVVQLGTRGSALYNCADITFRSTASLLAADQCQNSTNVGGVGVMNAHDMSSMTSSGGASSTSGAAAATSSTGAAANTRAWSGAAVAGAALGFGALLSL